MHATIPSSARGRDLQIPASDGLLLNATLFEPEAPRAAVIVSSATATPRGFYRAFAKYLCNLGAAVVTYDYRGSGGDIEALRRSDARMRDWGERDFPGVIASMRERYPVLDLFAVGHSVGGHVLLLANNASEIKRAVVVATQNGYWKRYRGVERWRVYALMRWIMPLATRLYGYFPGEALRFGENLAPGIMREWGTWCCTPTYFFDDPTMATLLANANRFTAPTLMIGLADDPWATKDAIDAFEAGFVAAPVRRLELSPESAGVEAIGHMGFFRAASGPALWPIVAADFGFDIEEKEHA
jgi:predicted alpha/beta hydrolase